MQNITDAVYWRLYAAYMWLRVLWAALHVLTTHGLQDDVSKNFEAWEWED